MACRIFGTQGLNHGLVGDKAGNGHFFRIQAVLLVLLVEGYGAVAV